jgi:hypothetical protein
LQKWDIEPEGKGRLWEEVAGGEVERKTEREREKEFGISRKE